MEFDPSQFGAIPVSNFNAASFGAIPAGVFQPAQPTAKPGASHFNNPLNPSYQESNLPEGVSTSVSKNFLPSLNAGIKETGQSLIDPLKGGAKNVEKIASNVGQDVKNIGTDDYKGGGFSKGFQAGGNVAKAVLSPLTEIANVGVKDIADKASNIKTVQNFANSKVGKAITDTAGVPQEKYDEWAQKHPEAAKNLEALANIAALGTSVPAGEAAGSLAKEGLDSSAEALKPGLNKVKTDISEAANKALDLAKKTDVRLGGEASAKAVSANEAAATKQALEITSPTLNKKSSISALENSGKSGGATESTIKGIKVSPDQHAMDVANSVKDVVKKGNTAVKNNSAINAEITRISEEEIKPFLRENPAPFNQKTLNAHIRNNVEIPNYIKADPVLQKTYDLTRESMMQEVSKKPKTMEGLWDARKSFDNIAERQVGKLSPTSEKVAAAKQAVLDVRRAVNDYISENTPNGNEEFRAKLKDLSNKYEARHNIAEKNYQLVNEGGIAALKAKYPNTTKALKATGIGGTAIAGERILHKITGRIIP